MKRLVLALTGLLLAAGLTGCEDHDAGSSASTHSPFRAMTEYGELAGVSRDGVLVWRGIPYAAPPVGELRWRPPAQPQPWSGVRRATAYGHSCMQGRGGGLAARLVGPITDVSEDCLYLNVSRPNDAGDDLPVMVWIHGGGFTSGTASLPVYNSPALVKRGVVLVTINYRLGRLGFFAHPALTEESGEQVANYGLLDQIAALQWVRDNIAAFGGDPDDVTIFGESAGGMSVDASMSSPRAAGLFDRAISESGLGREPSESFVHAEKTGEQLATSLDAPHATTAQLRALPAARLAAQPLDLIKGAAPVLDDVLPRSVSATFEAGDEADVPYVVGTNDLELPDSFFTAGGRDPDRIRDRLLGERKPAALAAYGGEEALDQHLLSDLVFTEPARHLAELHGRRAPAYLYRFEVLPPALATLDGAPHGMEIPYVFDTADEPAGRAAEISAAWVEFARSGEPGWPEVGDGSLVRFTDDGWRVTDDDPWRRRLDAVAAGYDRRS